MMKHVSLHVFGDVQGVFFRATAKVKADEFGVKGFIRNEADGNIYCEAEGNEASIEKFIEWCHRGPAHAQVMKVIVKEGTIKMFHQFDIIR